MKKMLGFISLWIAAGMLLMFFVSNSFAGILLIATFIIIGVKLFFDC